MIWLSVFFLFRWLCWLLACWNGYTHSQRVPGKKVKNHVYVWLNAQCVIYSQRVCACTFCILCTGPVERTTSGCLACGVGWSGVPNSIHVLGPFCWMSVHVSVTIICTGSAPWEGCLPVPVLHLLSVWLLIPSFLFFSPFSVWSPVEHCGGKKALFVLLRITALVHNYSFFD